MFVPGICLEFEQFIRIALGFNKFDPLLSIQGDLTQQTKASRTNL